MTAPRTLPAAELADGPGASTKERLLAAAARLLVEQGYAAVSIRAVTKAAGLSVSSAHYHFGSKEALVREAVRTRLEPLTARRLERLEAVRHAGSRGIEPIVEAFLAPALEFSAGLGDAALAYRRLPASLHFVPMETVQQLWDDVFGDLVQRFVEALAAALPGRDHTDLTLAFQLCIGAMVHATGGRAEGLLGPEAEIDDERMLACLVRFVSRGILASCPPLESEESA